MTAKSSTYQHMLNQLYISCHYLFYCYAQVIAGVYGGRHDDSCRKRFPRPKSALRLRDESSRVRNDFGVSITFTRNVDVVLCWTRCQNLGGHALR